MVSGDGQSGRRVRRHCPVSQSVSDRQGQLGHVTCATAPPSIRYELKRKLIFQRVGYVSRVDCCSVECLLLFIFSLESFVTIILAKRYTGDLLFERICNDDATEISFNIGHFYTSTFEMQHVSIRSQSQYYNSYGNVVSTDRPVTRNRCSVFEFSCNEQEL